MCLLMDTTARVVKPSRAPASARPRAAVAARPAPAENMASKVSVQCLPVRARTARRWLADARRATGRLLQGDRLSQNGYGRRRAQPLDHNSQMHPPGRGRLSGPRDRPHFFGCPSADGEHQRIPRRRRRGDKRPSDGGQPRRGAAAEPAQSGAQSQDRAYGPRGGGSRHPAIAQYGHSDGQKRDRMTAERGGQARPTSQDATWPAGKANGLRTAAAITGPWPRQHPGNVVGQTAQARSTRRRTVR